MGHKKCAIISANIRQSIIKKLDLHTNALEFAIVKLYINYQESQIWENTKLEGYFVLINDSYTQSLKIQIFDIISLNKDFEIELYSNIEDGYEILKDNFHSIEFPTFFIGLNFPEKNHARKIHEKIIIYSKIKNLEINFSALNRDNAKDISLKDLNNNNKDNLKSDSYLRHKTINKPSLNILNNGIYNKMDSDNLMRNKNHFRQLKSSEIKFEKVDRILELEIKTNSNNPSKNPIISPEINTQESKYLFEKYISSNVIYFDSIISLYNELKIKYDIKPLYIIGDTSILQIEDELNEGVKKEEHQNENEEDFKSPNVNKRNTIKVRSLSYLKRKDGQNRKTNKHESATKINKNEINKIKEYFKSENYNGNGNDNQEKISNTISIANNNLNKINFNKNELMKSNGNLNSFNEKKKKEIKLVNTIKNVIQKKDEMNKNIEYNINRFSNNKFLNHAIQQRRNLFFPESEEFSSNSIFSDS